MKATPSTLLTSAFAKDDEDEAGETPPPPLPVSSSKDLWDDLRHDNYDALDA